MLVHFPRGRSSEHHLSAYCVEMKMLKAFARFGSHLRQAAGAWKGFFQHEVILILPHS